jgi:TRAP-type mannitol/chloroaromatic compound transport system permease large subunit
VDGAKWVEHLLTGLPGGQVGFLIVVNVFVFFLAFFLDFFEIAFIIVPMLAPVAQKMGIDLIWFGVLLCVNLQTSFMHPPFGFALFYLRGIADTLFKDKRISVPVKSNDIYMGAIPWVIMQIILVFVVIFVPQSVTMFLDEKVVVDIDKVKIEMPAEESSSADLKALELSTTPGSAPADATTSSQDADKAAAEEQKKIDDLFKK